MNNPNFFIDALRTIFSWLDSLGYFLLDAVYDIFFTVANANIFQGVTINEFYTRVQLIFGVFMIFKLSITLLQMIINPDMFKDKQKGASSLVTRIAVILVLLTLIVPIEGISNTENSLNEQISSNGILFGFLYEIQNTVIEDQVLTKLVLGYGGDSTDAEPGNMSDVGSHLAATVAQAFIRPTLSSEANDDEITALTEDDGDNSYESNVACNGGEADAYFNGDLTAGTLIDHINDTCDSDNDGEVYVFDYTILGGLLCSIIMVLIILGFTIDVAVRAVKLAILRLIAPIPIISYIDPSQGKDGAFNNWVKTLTSTYLSLFVRLIIIYFGAYLIILLTDSNDNFSIIQSGTSVSTSFFATIFIIIGILMFMKDAPKFFQDMLGLKGDGKLFSGIGTILGAGVATLGTVGAFQASRHASRLADEERHRADPNYNPNSLLNRGKHALAGVTGGLLGFGTGMHAAMTAKNHAGGAAFSSMAKRNASVLSAGRSGGTFWGAVGSSGRQLLTGESTYDALESDWKAREQVIKADELALRQAQDNNAHRKSIMDRAKSKAVDEINTTGSYGGITGNYRDYHSVYTAAIQQGVGVKTNDAGQKYFDFHGQSVLLDQAQSIDIGLLDKNTANYYEQVVAGTIDDASITSNREAYYRATGHDLEAVYGGEHGLKAAYGREASANTATSDDLNRRRTALNNERTGYHAQRSQANAQRFNKGK